ncbi:gluconate 2-dehydrogenase subunit 3 family protein, partial [Salmonella enterica subsp. enterica]|nr:gluconate 2-dehydrogenase subunit 3 family protein [Salmonella enterica subsp. enterica]
MVTIFNRKAAEPGKSGSAAQAGLSRRELLKRGGMASLGALLVI